MACRLVGQLRPKTTALFLCDLQEKFQSSIQYFDQIVEVSSRLLRAAKLLDVPVVVTEQYPKGNFIAAVVTNLLLIVNHALICRTWPHRKRIRYSGLS